MHGNGTDGRGDAQVMHAMSVDDAYHVEHVLAQGVGGVTELVTIDGAGPFVRKKIPRDQARRSVWAALGDCRSLYLPTVRATYEMPDAFVIVHDYVPGVTLEQHVMQHGPLLPEDAARMASNVCGAVGELHAHGVIHRDLTPANVILAHDGAHLIDLGIARMTHEAASCVTTPLGTWGFAAPEQFGFEGKGTDARSDVYSIGRLLGFALTGIHPNSDDERYATLLRDPRTVPPALRAVIERACAFEPSARFQNVAEFADALAGRETDVGRPGGSPTEEPRPIAETAPIFAPDRSPLQGSQASGSAPAMPPTAAEAHPVPSPAETSAHASRRSPRRKRALVIALAGLCAVGVLIGGIALATQLLPAADPAPTSSSSDDPDAASGSWADETARNIANSVLNGSSSSLPGASSAANVPVPEVVESGWSPVSNGFVNFVFGLKNPSDDHAIRYPTVKITGRAADGTILFSTEAVLNYLGPGQTTYFGSVAESEEIPATVEFTPVEPEAYNVEEPVSPLSELSVTNLSEIPGSFGAASYTGEVSASAGEQPSLTSRIAVTVVLRDADGNPVFGMPTFASLPPEGGSSPFEASLYDVPDHASYDVYAQYW